MRLSEQRDTAVKAMELETDQIRHLIVALHRKMRAPFPDGTVSNQVNAETDVLPTLGDMHRRLEEALEAMGVPS